MIALPPAGSRAPLTPGDNLIAHLGASPLPAVVHYAAEGRTELSGRVAVNWATKMTHLLDTYGVAGPGVMLVDVPGSWRSIVLALGVAWCDLSWTGDPLAAEAVLTDRPANHGEATGEIFVTQDGNVDSGFIDVDDEVLSHADQALLPVPDLITAARNAVTDTTAEDVSQEIPGVTVHQHGTVLHTAGARLTPTLWSAIIEAWRRSTPVVLVDAGQDLEAIVAAERLGTTITEPHVAD